MDINGDIKGLLNISSDTIQRLRIADKLRSSKIGGVHYYRCVGIEALLEDGIKRKDYAAE